MLSKDAEKKVFEEKCIIKKAKIEYFLQFII